MPSHSMIALRDRFIPNPVLPDAMVEQQNGWRERWGMRPRSPAPGEDWRYYFDPTEVAAEDPNDPRQRLRYAILEGQRDTKHFLTGSRGAGKSTTAHALWDDPKINERYTVLGFTVHDYLNLAEPDASQVIVVMIAHLVEALRDAGLVVDSRELRGCVVVEALEGVLASLKPRTGDNRAGVDVFGRLTAMLQCSATARRSIRNLADGRFGELVGVLDELGAVLEGRTGKELLFVVDGLDGIVGDERRRSIFHVGLPLLLCPRCSVLYCYPIEVLHDARFDMFERGQLDRHELANVRLADRPGGPMLAEGREIMTQLVLPRLEGMRLDEVFDLSSSEWDRVLHYSAGNFGALARLLSHAFEIAGMVGKERVDRRCFELALRRLRAELGRFVQQHRALLLRVREHQLAAAELPGGRAKGVAADAVV